ncbi:MAG: sigma-70 family RNA polymerase sigma factor [Acidobacteria bacterium]|nr:MAG: sigma-70 family RNA polymerase sigma factor [Acidobacteriota bacterium]
MRKIDFSVPEFLDRLRQRDPAGWEAIVDAYLPQLLRAARGMGFSSDVAQDLAQSVFVALMESIGRFEGRSHIRTFLFGIFYNKVSEHLREKQKVEGNDPIDDVMESKFDLSGKWRQPPADIEQAVFGREVGGMIQDCLQSVPQTQRIVFHMREVEEMTTEEICKKMAISGTNLGVLLFRARNRLRECLEKKGLKKDNLCIAVPKSCGSSRATNT